jgi:PAS domain S-box-containing protein
MKLVESVRTPTKQGYMETASQQRNHETTSPLLADTQRELSHLLASVPTILISLTLDWQVTRWNPMAEKVLGWRAADILGTVLDGERVKWDWNRIRAGLDRCREAGSAVRVDDIRFRTRDRSEGFLGITVNPILDEGGQTQGFVIIGADITDRKAMMNQLNQAQKLKSIGQLAAGIAHEINTPTQYVGDNVRFLHEAFEDMSRVLESYGRMLSAVKAGNATSDLIDEIDHCLEEADLDYLAEEIPLAIEHTLDGVGRISKIVKAMKEFSHPGREEKVPTDINKSIESTITVARNEWKYVAEMQTDLDASLPLVPCRPGEFNQVILNMIINAAHAIAEVPKDRQAAPGTIRIATDRVGGHARITISDTGTGIPPEIQSRIFDPFFTTKEVGRGTGQGLAICFPVIVEKHGGTIEVESEVGKGTSFTITLPLNPGDD